MQLPWLRYKPFSSAVWVKPAPFLNPSGATRVAIQTARVAEAESSLHPPPQNSPGRSHGKISGSSALTQLSTPFLRRNEKKIIKTTNLTVNINLLS